MKRTARHMTSLGRPSVEEYLAYVGSNPDALEQSRRTLSVTISRFFRDKQLWKDLQERFFPELTQIVPTPLRIWSAGCSCGEEAYSCAIAWDLFALNRPHLPAPHIFATDANPEALERAVQGVYSASSVKEIESSPRNRYFFPDPNSDALVISAKLKRIVKWARHDFMLEAPPLSDYHIVFLRNNLLTYYSNPTRDEALTKILSRLSIGGLLILGAHEDVPNGFTFMRRSRHNRMVFRKSPNRNVG